MRIWQSPGTLGIAVCWQMAWQMRDAKRVLVGGEEANFPLGSTLDKKLRATKWLLSMWLKSLIWFHWTASFCHELFMPRTTWHQDPAGSVWASSVLGSGIPENILEPHSLCPDIVSKWIIYWHLLSIHSKHCHQVGFSHLAGQTFFTAFPRWTTFKISFYLMRMWG